MKKIYQNPTTKVITLQVSRMICLSGQIDPSKTIDNPGGFGARRGDIDFDDFDEEY